MKPFCKKETCSILHFPFWETSVLSDDVIWGELQDDVSFLMKKDE